MPIYEFQCNACGHRFDELMRLSDPDPAACPACGAAQVQRQVTAPTFRLAGAGWYETDFKGDKDSKRNLAGEKELPVEKPKDEKADAKPAAEPKAAAGGDVKKPAATSRPKTAAKRPSLRRRRSRT